MRRHHTPPKHQALVKNRHSRAPCTSNCRHIPLVEHQVTKRCTQPLDNPRQRIAASDAICNRWRDQTGDMSNPEIGIRVVRDTEAESYGSRVSGILQLVYTAYRESNTGVLLWKGVLYIPAFSDSFMCACWSSSVTVTGLDKNFSSPSPTHRKQTTNHFYSSFVT